MQEFSQEMQLKNVAQKLEEINASDVCKIGEEDFKNSDSSKISKMPDSLPAYQVFEK